MEVIMGIIYNEEQRLFHLQTSESSYILQVLDCGYLAHLYWGKPIRNFNTGHALSKENFVNLDVLPQEYSVFGTGDLRTPSVEVLQKNGSTTSELKYITHHILSGKPALKGLPASYAESEEEATTLEIILRDAVSGLEAILTYTVFEAYPVITRSVRLTNTREDKQSLKLLRALSVCIDFETSDYELLQLSGAWCREKHIYRRPLVPGLQGVDSKRGFSSHQQNPFIALLTEHTTENQGEVYAFNLAYSGNFLAEVEVDQFLSARVQMGIQPFDFSWNLDWNQTFQTPEVILVFSDKGLGKMSRIYHKFYRDRLCKGTYKNQERPILINNWEATYFQFDEEKIKQIATSGKELGMELFVLDDGWFGKRDSDNSSLGDWVVDKNKLPHGLDTLVGSITDKGIRFGLWFEPEMISPDSYLYRVHPDWCLHVPDRTPLSSPSQRNQLVLDLSREDVCNKIIDMLSHILSSAPISYVKWDMNRSFSDMGSALLPESRQREIAHRYILGLYHVLDVITERFPNVLFESCASGGGRYDPGMLYYMPQTWTSDDTDAMERLKIQYGTSLVYPAITMGSHISDSPNHQVGRSTSLVTRGNVAMAGNFGYELDLTKLTDEEKALVKKQVAFYKTIRPVIQFGNQYRLLSPFEGNDTAWIYVNEAQTEAVAFYYRILAAPNMPYKKVKLEGLHPDYQYRVNETGVILGGDELMNSGIKPEGLHGDFASCCLTLSAVQK
jgi:alpha-galactosidase